MQIDHFLSPFVTGIVYKLLKSDHIHSLLYTTNRKGKSNSWKEELSEETQKLFKIFYPELE